MPIVHNQSLYACLFWGKQRAGITKKSWVMHELMIKQNKLCFQNTSRRRKQWCDK